MYSIVVHGGAGGTSPEAEEGCRYASCIGEKALRIGSPALDAVVGPVTWMEDSIGLFNAGLNSDVRVDGRSIEMEAMLATSQGLVRTVEVVSGVQNPVLVAMESRSLDVRRLSGTGAFEFAMERGLKQHPGPTEKALEKLRKLKEEVRQALSRGEVPSGWTEADLLKYIDCESGVSSGSAEPVRPAVSTIGAIALDKAGVFALAASTGGSGLMRKGRGGDVPIRRAGWEIGAAGGVLATGIGEAILDMDGAGLVYQLLAMGLQPQVACEQIVLRFPADVPVGFVALTRGGVGIHSNYPMPSHFMTVE